MKIVAIIVSYANRYDLCRQVVESCIVEGVDQVIVVNNGSERTSADQLQLLEQKHNNVLKVLSLPTNTGSAGGYRSGLKFALKECEADFLWLLDDDTVPNSGALDALLKAYEQLSKTDKRVVLFSYRGDTRPDDFEAVTEGTIKRYLPNNFCGVNFTKIVCKKIKRLWALGKHPSEITYPIIKVEFGPYGGMFIRPLVVSQLGFPKEAFFVYADDHEYTNRLEIARIPQYLIYESKLMDIDISIGRGSTFFSKSVPDFRVFYSIRNHSYLSQMFIKNRVFYTANKIAFLANLALSSIPDLTQNPKHTLHRMALVRRAIRDGEDSKLGNTL